jgi:hypothetical protein
VTDQETLEGLADYFSPTVTSVSSDSGSEYILEGAASSTLGLQASGATPVKFPTALQAHKQNPLTPKVPQETNRP